MADCKPVQVTIDGKIVPCSSATFEYTLAEESSNRLWEQIREMHKNMPKSLKDVGKKRMSEYDDNRSVDEKVRDEVRKRREQAELDRKLDLLGEYNENDYPNGTVLRFEKVFESFSGSKEKRTIVALLSDNTWYTAGKASRSAYLWDDFVHFLVSGPDPVSKDRVQVLGN